MNRRNFIIGAVSIPVAILTAKYLPTFESKWYDGLGEGLWGQLMYKGFPVGKPVRFATYSPGYYPDVYMDATFDGGPYWFDSLRLWSSKIGELATVKDFNFDRIGHGDHISVIGRIT